MIARLKLFKILTLVVLTLLVASLVSLDQLTKIKAESQLMIWEHPTNLRQYQGKPHYLWSSTEVRPSQGSDAFYLYLGFNYVCNQGAAWGMLSELDDKYRVPFFYAVTAIAVLVILYYLWTTPMGHRLAWYAMVLILSGALGNFVDRVRLGYVIDWIDVRWNIGSWFYNFPNFNVADSCISVGVFLLLIDTLLLEALRRRRLRKLPVPDPAT